MPGYSGAGAYAASTAAEENRFPNVAINGGEPEDVEEEAEDYRLAIVPASFPGGLVPRLRLFQVLRRRMGGLGEAETGSNCDGS